MISLHLPFGSLVLEMYICIAGCRTLDQSCDDGAATPDTKCCDTDPATKEKLECKNFKCIKKAGRVVINYMTKCRQLGQFIFFLNGCKFYKPIENGFILSLTFYLDRLSFK